MERLTRKSDTSDMVWFIDREHKSGYAEREPCDMDAHHARLAIAKLAEYEGLDEQGKLLKLPCKPEDKLYWISDQDEDAEFTYEPIEEVEICNIDYNGYSLQLWFADKDGKEFPVLEVSSIGKELFYTKEEAEAALKELEGKGK